MNDLLRDRYMKFFTLSGMTVHSLEFIQAKNLSVFFALVSAPDNHHLVISDTYGDTADKDAIVKWVEECEKKPDQFIQLACDVFETWLESSMTTDVAIEEFAKVLATIPKKSKADKFAKDLLDFYKDFEAESDYLRAKYDTV